MDEAWPHIYSDDELIAEQDTEIKDMVRLLERALPYVPCEGPSTDPCVRCQISRTVTGSSQHTYPNGTVGPRLR